MTKLMRLAAVAILATGAAPGNAADAVDLAAAGVDWTAVVTGGVKVVAYRRISGDPPGMEQTGSQITLPVDARFDYRGVDNWSLGIGLRTALFASNRSFAGGAFAGSHAGVTDTILSARVAYFGFGAVVPFYEASANLPTGQSVLLGNAKLTRMDPDIVDLPAYGEGFGLLQRVGAIAHLSPETRLTAAYSLNLRGVYSKEDFADAVHRIDPSTVHAATLKLDHDAGSYAFTLGAGHGWEGATQYDGALAFRDGATWSLDAGLTRRWDNGAETALTVAWSHATRDDVPDGVGGLIPDVANFNGSSLAVAGSHRMTIGEMTLTGRAGFLRRFANGFDPSTLAFVPPRTKISGGLEAEWKRSDRLSFTAGASAFWLRDDPQPAFPDPAYSYLGVALTAGLKARF